MLQNRISRQAASASALPLPLPAFLELVAAGESCRYVLKAAAACRANPEASSWVGNWLDEAAFYLRREAGVRNMAVRMATPLLLEASKRLNLSPKDRTLLLAAKKALFQAGGEVSPNPLLLGKNATCREALRYALYLLLPLARLYGYGGEQEDEDFHPLVEMVAAPLLAWAGCRSQGGLPCPPPLEDVILAAAALLVPPAEFFVSAGAAMWGNDLLFDFDDVWDATPPSSP